MATKFDVVSDSRNLILKSLIDGFTVTFTYMFTNNPKKVPYVINFNASESDPSNPMHTGNTVITGSLLTESGKFTFETFIDSEESEMLPVAIKKACKELLANYDR